MHILYIHQHFATPQGSTGTRSYEFARRWVKAGHKVTLITGYYDLGGLRLSGGLISRQNIEGIDVVAVGTKYSNKQSYLRRIIAFISFMLFAAYVGLRTRNIDVIYATSTPLTVGIPALIIKWLKSVPLVFEVRDQWPEIPIELGIIKNRVIAKALLWLEKTIYKNSSAIVALSPGMAEGVRKVVGDKRQIATIPNCSDTDVFRPDIDGSAVRQKMGWGDKLVLLHAGAMGLANGLEFVIRAAERLREHADILFVLIGDGHQRPLLEQQVEHLGLNNAQILPSVPKQELSVFYAAVDVCLVIFNNYPILEHNSANKFFDALAAGKPVLLNYSGWQRQILEEHQAGLGCRLCDLDEFIEKVLYLSSRRSDLSHTGRNARSLAETRFSRDSLALQALAILKSPQGKHA
jgi:glycosyltransferase involved in cell wall biosynthesis